MWHGIIISSPRLFLHLGFLSVSHGTFTARVCDVDSFSNLKLARKKTEPFGDIQAMIAWLSLFPENGFCLGT